MPPFYKRIDANMELGVESLERRQMLAGNVTAQINGAGNLLINGDNLGNAIRVEIDASGNVDVTGQAGTTVDAGNLATSQVTGDVRINLRGGDDVVTLNGGYTNIPVDDVLMLTGAGDDFVYLEGAYGLTGNVRMVTGAGNDRAYVKYSGMSGDLRIITGAGNDGSYVGSVDQMRNALINSGAGNDYDFMNSSMAGGTVTLSSTSGDDQVRVVGSYSGVHATRGRNFSIRTGSGQDTVDVERSQAQFYDSGAGTTANSLLSIVTGSGDDVVNILDSRGDLRVTLSSGDDTLIIDGHTGGGRATGGGGTDGLTVMNDADMEDLKYSGFESYTGPV